MSKMLKATFMFVIVFSLILTACGPQEAPATEEPAAPAPAPTEEPAAAPTEEPAMTEEPMMLEVDPTGQTVVFWHVWGTGSASEGLAKIVDEFNSSNEWGITVEAVDQGQQGDLQSAVNAAIATGELPNITPGFPNALATWYGAGAAADLNQFINDPMFGLTADEVAAIYPANLASGTLGDGAQVGMPIHASENVLVYNYTWARELGFDNAPSTSAEFMEQICAAAAANNADDNPDNDGTGGFVLYPDASQVSSWLFAFGGSLVNDAGDGYTMNTPEMKEVALFLKEMSDNGCSFATESYPNPEQANRLALVTASSTAGVPFYVSAYADGAYPDDEWGLLPFPGPDGKLAVNSFGQLIGIMDQSPEANLATWIWLKYFTSPEVQAEWITYSGYFPSQTTTDQYLGDYIASDVHYAEGLELAQYGDSEPNFASWGALRGEIRDAFYAALAAADEAEIDQILADLDTTAAELLAESQ